MKCSIVCSLFALVGAGCLVVDAAAFIARRPSSSRSTRYHRSLSLSSTSDGGGTGPADPTGELVRTLARIDALQRLDAGNKKGPLSSRWKKILLPKEQFEDSSSDTSFSDDESSSKPLTELQQQVDKQLQDYVYLLEPSNAATPSCTLVFLGGAGLGQFPQVAYNEFLTRVSDKLGAAVLTAPYQVGLDHFSLSKETGERLRRALLYCQDELQYPESQPVYALGHSLGCKLHTIYLGAVSSAMEESPYRGIGYIAFNNYGFSQTIGMARSFAKELQQNAETTSSSPFGDGGTSQFFNQVFDFAELAVGSMGIEFSPSPSDTKRIIEMKFDDELISKTRLFQLNDDTLDSTPDFLECCAAATTGGATPAVSNIPGNHLAPVYFKLDLDELELDDMAKQMAKEASQGFQSISFGEERDLQSLVEEVCNFLLGKPPRSIPRLAEANSGS